MSNTIAPRYLPAYRRREMSLICDCAMRGVSLCFLGVAGSGKSNLIKSLRGDASMKRRYLGENTDSVCFVSVNAEGWDGTADSLWRQMFRALAKATGQPTTGVDAQGDTLLQTLGDLIDNVCAPQDKKVMFLLDEFDDVFRKGPRSTLDQFSHFRSSEDNRGILSYTVFTRKLPHVLSREHDLAAQSKFFDLFRRGIYALPMHEPADAKQMLLHLNDVANQPLDDATMDYMVAHLIGGHAGLGKAIFDEWLEMWGSTPVNLDGSAEALSQRPVIRDELFRILNGLHRQEREIALRYARGKTSSADKTTIDHLYRRGLINETGGWFSPLMNLCIHEYPDD